MLGTFRASSRTARLHRKAPVWKQFPFSRKRDVAVAYVPGLQPADGSNIGVQQLSPFDGWASACQSQNAETQIQARSSTSSSSRDSDNPDQKLVEEIIARLKLDPSLCKAVAARVDSQTAEIWAIARGSAISESLETSTVDVTRPTVVQLWQLHLRMAVPFVGFGFFDNMIMLSAGDAIDGSLGVVFGFSTLAAAGMGQMISDSVGITLQGLIERFADRLGLPDPKLTREQHNLSLVKSVSMLSKIWGIIFGCAIGMFPLLFMAEKKPHLVDQICEKLPPDRRLEFHSLVKTITFHPGEALLRQGELSDRVFLIDSGQVDCKGRDAEGLPFLISTMSAGQTFGKPQLECPSHVDLLVSGDEPVVVQAIKKDEFLRITGEVGKKFYQDHENSEHAVYFAQKGGHVMDAVPEAQQGTGKTRIFASLSDEDKMAVLQLTGRDEVRRFKGAKGEGKVAFFAKLPESVKHDVLQEWQQQRIDQARRLGFRTPEAPQ